MTNGNRAVSPLVGVLLLVVLTLLISSVISYQLTELGGGLESKRAQYEDSVATLSGNPWSGEKGDVFRVSNNEAGATNVKYRVNFTIEPGSPVVGENLGHLYIEVTTGTPDMFSNSELDDLITAGVDVDSDGSIDYDLSSDIAGWEVKNGGSGLKIDSDDTDYVASEGDSIIMVFEGVDNPDSPGEYELRAETNGKGNWHNGTITIIE